MTKIMIVEDEEDTRDVIKLFLQNEGYEIETAANGVEFLNKVDEFYPDIVTLDVMMPGPTTREILSGLKERVVNPKIILLTVVDLSDVEVEHLQHLGNIVDYILKPFELRDLLDRIHKHTIKTKEHDHTTVISN